MEKISFTYASKSNSYEKIKVTRIPKRNIKMATLLKQQIIPYQKFEVGDTVWNTGAQEVKIFKIERIEKCGPNDCKYHFNNGTSLIYNSNCEGWKKFGNPNIWSGKIVNVDINQFSRIKNTERARGKTHAVCKIIGLGSTNQSIFVEEIDKYPDGQLNKNYIGDIGNRNYNNCSYLFEKPREGNNCYFVFDNYITEHIRDFSIEKIKDEPVRNNDDLLSDWMTSQSDGRYERIVPNGSAVVTNTPMYPMYFDTALLPSEAIFYGKKKHIKEISCDEISLPKIHSGPRLEPELLPLPKEEPESITYDFKTQKTKTEPIKYDFKPTSFDYKL